MGGRQRSPASAHPSHSDLVKLLRFQGSSLQVTQGREGVPGSSVEK